MNRLLISVALGALLPLALMAGIVMQAESHALHPDRAAFYILLPMLFGLMALAVWTLYSPRSRSALR